MPEVCPVCLREADDITRLTIQFYSFGGAQESENSHEALRRKLAWSGGKITFGLPGPVIGVPTCRDHKMKGRSDCAKALWFIIMLAGIYPAVFFLFQFTNAYFRSGDYFTPLVLWLGTMLVLIAWSAYIFFPTSFQRHFKLLGIDPVGEYFLFSFKNPQYAEIFMQLNPMHADVVEESTAEAL